MPSLRDWKPKTAKPQAKLDYYHQYKSSLRPHQVEALQACQTANKGQIISPCGTGKTRIQICLHVETMLSKVGETATCVIASHRLSLNRQLRDELVDIFVHCGLSFDILSIGSDRSDTEAYYAKYANLGYSPTTSRHLSSLNTKDIEEFVAQAKRDNRHLLVVSTYNSIDRLAHVGSIDLITYDEAHNIVREDFTANILKLRDNTLRGYYFTATRKIKSNSGGMNDEELFGTILYDFKPQKALEAGEIACPRIHLIRGAHSEITNNYNLTMLVKNMMDAFSQHKDRVKRDSATPEEIGAKIIVGCNGIEEMMNVYQHQDLKDFVDDIPCFAISSNGCYVNWKTATPTEFFTQLRSLKDSQDALIFNVDMLTEGIDLPTITGVMPLRNLGVIKLIQLLGRALRLTSQDRARVYAGELTPGQYQSYVKPFGWVIISEHLRSLDDYREMKNIIKTVYAEYGTPVEELVIQEKFIDATPEDLTPMIPFQPDDGKKYDLEHDFTDIIGACLEDLLGSKVSQLYSSHKKIEYLLSLLEETYGFTFID